MIYDDIIDQNHLMDYKNKAQHKMTLELRKKIILRNYKDKLEGDKTD